MAYYIAPDGKTIHAWEIIKGGIRLDNGQEISDEQLAETGHRGLFSTHPEENPFLSRDADGVWVFSNPFDEAPPRSMKRS
jgi:hypothetical protein